MNRTAPSVEVCVGSILFSDLVGFTEYTDELGDTAALDVLDHQTQLVTAALDGHRDARIVKEIGDGLMLWFGSAIDALACATALLGAFRQARDHGAFPLSVRMGIHHGEAVARGDDLIGRTVNIASRMSDLAGPGELLVSDDVLAACGEHEPGLVLHPVGPATVKGVQEPIWLHRVTLSSPG